MTVGTHSNPTLTSECRPSRSPTRCSEAPLRRRGLAPERGEPQPGPTPARRRGSRRSCCSAASWRDLYAHTVVSEDHPQAEAHSEPTKRRQTCHYLKPLRSNRGVCALAICSDPRYLAGFRGRFPRLHLRCQEGSPYTLSFDDKGHFHVTRRATRWKLRAATPSKAAELQLTDTQRPLGLHQGRRADRHLCLEIRERVLTFSKVADKCADRVGSLINLAWSQQSRVGVRRNAAPQPIFCSCTQTVFSRPPASCRRDRCRTPAR